MKIILPKDWFEFRGTGENADVQISVDSWAQRKVLQVLDKISPKKEIPYKFPDCLDWKNTYYTKCRMRINEDKDNEKYNDLYDCCETLLKRKDEIKEDWKKIPQYVQITIPDEEKLQEAICKIEEYLSPHNG